MPHLAHPQSSGYVIEFRVGASLTLTKYFGIHGICRKSANSNQHIGTAFNCPEHISFLFPLMPEEYLCTESVSLMRVLSREEGQKTRERRFLGCWFACLALSPQRNWADGGSLVAMGPGGLCLKERAVLGSCVLGRDRCKLQGSLGSSLTETFLTRFTGTLLPVS